MSKLSKTNKYSVLWLAYQGKSVEEISKELALPETMITNLLEKNNTTNKDAKKLKGSEPAVVSTPKAKTKVDKMMIHNTAGKRNSGVAIMTKEASETIEEHQKKFKGLKRNRTEESIFRPNG